MPSMMVQSAGIKRLLHRHEFESRRSLDQLAPTGRVAKKAATPPHRLDVDEGSIILALPAPLTAARATSGAACVDEPIKEGALVRVRTRVSKICAGGLTIHLVLRLNAVVVSADEDGFLDVIYEAKFPRDDPSQIVRVARDQVMVMPPAVPYSAKSKEKDAPRPTTGGKSVRLLTKVLKERERCASTTQIGVTR